MRYTSINGIDLICAIKELATRGDKLTYEAYLTGKELLQLLNSLKITNDGILPNKNYTVISHDW